MTLFTLDGVAPQIDPEAWVAPGAQVIGDIRLSAKSSVWFGAVLRGDNEPIVLGEGSNIQDNSVCHTDMGFPLTIGRNCTIGHKAILHGCTIGDGCLVGMGATILNGAHLTKNVLLGAGALVTEGKAFPEGTLVVGAPAKVVRDLTADEIEGMQKTAQGYQANLLRFRAGLAGPGPT